MLLHSWSAAQTQAEALLMKCNSGSLTASFLKRVCDVSNCSTITNYNDCSNNNILMQSIISIFHDNLCDKSNI